MTDISCFTRILDPDERYANNMEGWHNRMITECFFVEGEGWIFPDEIASVLRNRDNQGLDSHITCSKHK